MSKFCPLPFSHMAIRPNGNVYPCCIFRWDGVPEDLHLDHPDVFNHPFLENIRNQMRRGEIVEGCKTCHLNEEQSGSSMRTFVLEHMHKADMPSQPVDDPKIKYLDLALSNACNNKCRMCNAELSTSWYSDWKALGGTIPKGLLVKPQNNLDKIDFSELRFLKLIGGEPLMEQEKFIDILSKCDRKKLSILLTTNATLVPNEKLFSLMKECELLKVNLSIDATESLNDFLRKGSKWEKTVEVIEWFYKNFNVRDTNIAAVVSIYNVNCLDKLYTFLQDKFPGTSLTYIMIDGPDWMSPKHLPENVKSEILTKVSTWQKEKDIPIWNVLKNELTKNGDFREFMRKDKQLNDLRKEFWGDHNKELYEMVKHFYE